MNREYLREVAERRRELFESDTGGSESPFYGPNCFGAALYLVEETNVDGHVESYKAENILKGLEQISSPETGCLFVMESGGEPYHMGVVVNKNPLLIAHRRGIRSGFIPDQRIEQVLQDYSHDSEDNVGTIHYYKPKAMEERK